MKHLTIMTTLILLILATGVSAAEKPLPNQQSVIPPEVPVQQLYSSTTFLRLDPMLDEITTILKTMRIREDALLVELQNSTDERQTDRIIHRIKTLDTDRELALLKVQARYARLDGRFDLEREIKARILKILDNELAILF